MSDSNDLITADYATAALRAGGLTLDGGQAALLPSLITGASKAIVKELDRQFVSQSYDEVLEPLRGDPSAGERPLLKLAGSPVSAVASVRVDRVPVLRVQNTATTTNQRASVAFVTTGDPDQPHSIVRTGLTLSRTASGMTSTSSLTFADYVTLASLSTAINALSNGWTATVSSGYSAYASAELYGADGARSALAGVNLELFATEVDSYRLDRKNGTIELGDAWSYALYDCSYDSGEARVAYTAGFSTVPEPIQQACAELVKASFDRLPSDSTVQSESTKDYSYTMWAEVQSWPKSVTQLIDGWRSWSL